jgi:hypothetical protein
MFPASLVRDLEELPEGPKLGHKPCDAQVQRGWRVAAAARTRAWSRGRPGPGRDGAASFRPMAPH